MKTLTVNAEAQRVAPAKDVAWVVEVDWPTGTSRYANRDLILPGTQTMPLLLDFSRETIQPSWDGLPGGLVGERLSCVIRDSAAVADSPFGLPVRLRMLFINTDACTDDWITVFAGRINSFSSETNAIRLEAVDELTYAARKLINRSEETPWLFGRVADAPLLPLDSIAHTTLREAMSDMDIVPLNSIEGFPPEGLAQIGGEIISYAVIDEAAHMLGTLSLPVERAAPQSHARGEDVRSIPAEGLRFLIADHPCLAIDAVRGDGEALAPESYSAEIIERDGHDVQSILFSTWPMVEEPDNAPTRIFFQGPAAQSSWQVETTNNATTPESAFDGDPLSGAQISSVYPRLDLSFLPRDLNFATGSISAGRLFVVYSTAETWTPGVAANMTVSKEGESSSMNLPPTSGANVPMRISLELDTMIGAFGGWDFLRNSRVSVVAERTGPADSLVIRIDELIWELEFQPELAYGQAEALAATVQGYAEANVLVENPAQLLRILLTHPLFGDLSAQCLDEDSFDSMADSLQARGYIMALRLNRPEELSDLLQSILRECNGRLVSCGDTIRLLDCSALPETSSVLGNDSILKAGLFSIEDCINADVQSVNFGTVHEQVAATPPIVVVQKVFRALQGDANAQSEAARNILCQLKSQRRRQQVDCPLTAIAYEPGDSLRCNDERAQVLGIQQRHAHRLLIDLELPPQALTVLRQDRARVEMASDFSQLRIVIDEQCVAFLDREGNLAVAGMVIEDALHEQSLNNAIEYDAEAEALLFGYPDGDVYDAAIGFTRTGDVLLRGTLSEQSDAGSESMQAWHHCNAEGVQISTGLATPLLSHDVSNNTLHLRGQTKAIL